MTNWISIKAEQFHKYIQTPTASERLSILRDFRQSKVCLPLAITKDLFMAKLSATELGHVLDITQPESKIEFEFWVFDHFLQWPQDLAASALRAWAKVTDCVLWHRLLPILRLPGLPQRLHFSILDISTHFAGVEITSTALESSGWEDYSPAYHGLLFDRSIQFSLESKRLDSLAIKILNSAQNLTHPEDKSLQSAVGWLLRSGESKKILGFVSSKPEAAWKHFVMSSVSRHDDRKKELERAQKLLGKPNTGLDKVLEEWPAPWSRQGVSSDLIENLANLAHQESYADLPRLLDGCPTSMLLKAVKSMNSTVLQRVFCDFRAYLPQEAWVEISEAGGLETAGGVNDWCDSLKDTKLKNERSAMKTAQSNTASILLKNPSDLSTANNNRKPMNLDFYMPVASFFAALRGDSASSSDQNFWSELTHAWKNPRNCDLGLLAPSSRKQKGIATICYLTTLGRMVGNDEAVLKILDHIRTTEEDELRVIANSLGEINTTRSIQELISVITRPNATASIQQDVVNILAKRDVSALQKELRATVRDLQMPTDSTSVWFEIREALSNLIHTPADESLNGSTEARKTTTSGIDDKQLDEELGRTIPNYRDLSSEVRRALRTALFFNHSINGSEASHAIDLSPLIDMQYKAMELLFREFFEDAVSQSLQRGDIPRKLDVIGYARPIPQKMDEFENYIANLPVVREIPFFSKFKLRKTLRAMCQFQPGRRFTLDGLKAFGLFFLCFSRTQCKHGLANLFPIGMKDDLELAAFTKELHIFQDFRNRAAHEGFHPEASNDIQGIWRTTAFIVQGAFRIRDALADAQAAKPVAKAS